MAETIQQMLERRKRERAAKKTPAQEQADGLAAKPSPSPSPGYKGSFTAKASTERKEVLAPRDQSNPGYKQRQTVESSTTPAADAQRKATRLKTLDDDALSKQAEGGDFEARAEAQRRFKQGNARFKAYEKYGE